MFRAVDESILGSRPGKILLAVIIFLLALALRLPDFSYPNATVGDEGIYKTFVLNTIHHVPFFEIHPPLARSVFVFLSGGEELALQEVARKTNESFGDFPYQRIRLFNIILGSLIPVGVFLTGLLLFHSSGKALIPALLVVVDGMFIQYSRLMLPDTLLWCAGLSGIILFLFAFRYEKGFWRERLLLVLSAVAFGLTVSVKWTGVGFLLAAFFLLFVKRRTSFLFPMVVVSVLVYLSVSFGYFSQMEPGPMRVDRSYYYTDYVKQLASPVSKDFVSLGVFILENERTAMMVNNDSNLMGTVVRSGVPFQWPLAQAPHGLWTSDYGPKIIVIGNQISWGVALFSVSVLSLLVMFGISARRNMLSEEESFLLAGYFINYLPFLFIMFSRPMFVYHYGVSLFFAFLMIPPALARVSLIYTHKPQPLRYISYGLVFLIIAVFLLTLPTVYGV